MNTQEAGLNLAQVYADLWSTARAAFLRNGGQIDPLLQERAPDARRGLTVIFRPHPAVTARVAAWLAEVAADEPAQYVYTPDQLHVTVLSLFTATPDYAPYFARLPRYLAALEAALSSLPPFAVAFRGVTASPSTVMVQGFPANNTLERVRDALRTAITAAGLGDDLDRRYRLVTAHLSALRLRACPLCGASRPGARFRFWRDAGRRIAAGCQRLVHDAWRRRGGAPLSAHLNAAGLRHDTAQRVDGVSHALRPTETAAVSGKRQVGFQRQKALITCVA